MATSDLLRPVIELRQNVAACPKRACPPKKGNMPLNSIKSCMKYAENVSCTSPEVAMSKVAKLKCQAQQYQRSSHLPTAAHFHYENNRETVCCFCLFLLS